MSKTTKSEGITPPMEEQIEELCLTSPQKPHKQEKSNVKYLSCSEEKKKP